MQTWYALWRLGSESNRRRRICNPLHHHSATEPYRSMCSKKARSIQTSLGLSLRITRFYQRGDAGTSLHTHGVGNPLVLDKARRALSRNLNGVNAKIYSHCKLIRYKRARNPNMAAMTPQPKLSTQSQKTPTVESVGAQGCLALLRLIRLPTLSSKPAQQ